MEEHTILLVDDEALSVSGIEQNIDWQALHISQVYRAYSKEMAIEILQQHPVSIVFTDIEMPGGTGLELVQWLNENLPETVCVLYTCHAEFSYAHEAVRLQVLDYVLKPVAYPQLQEVLRRAVSVLEKRLSEKKMMEIYRDNEEDGGEDAVERVKAYIVEHIGEDLRREELARKVYMSPDYLSKVFKKSENMTIVEYISEKRLQLAAKLLEFTNLSITDIAQRVGIDDVSYFIKKFRARYQVTPQQYRNQNQE